MLPSSEHILPVFIRYLLVKSQWPLAVFEVQVAQVFVLVISHSRNDPSKLFMANSISYFWSLLKNYYFIFFQDFIYLFLERGLRREKEREGNINV